MVISKYNTVSYLGNCEEHVSMEEMWQFLIRVMGSKKGNEFAFKQAF